jgi:hypothetical protein
MKLDISPTSIPTGRGAEEIIFSLPYFTIYFQYATKQKIRV